MKVINTGYGNIIDDDVFGAKEEAIAEALRGAIEQVMEPMVKPEIISKNMRLVEDYIFSNTIGYIHRYEIISSGINIDSLYVVTLTALIAWKEIEEDLDVLGLLHNRLGKPSLMIMINESSPDFDSYGGTGSVEQSLINKFINKEFEIVEFNYVMDTTFTDDHNLARSIDSVAINLGDNLGADVVIIGESKISMMGDGGESSEKIISIKADIRLKAVKADNGVVIAEVSGSAIYPHGKPILATVRAIAKVTSKVTEEMAAVIQHRWITEVNAGRPILLRVEDVGDFGNFTKFKSSLGDLINGLLDVNGRSYDGNSGEFELIVRSIPEKMAAELGGQSFGDSDIRVEALTINTLTISLAESN